MHSESGNFPKRWSMVMADDERALEDQYEPLRAVPDLKGACVIDANGHVAGELFGALAEIDSGLLRYLDLALIGADKHVLVPIGHARVDRKNDTIEIQLRAATREELFDMPQFTPGEERVQVNHEETVHASARAFSGERYYAHPAYDHKRLYVGDHPVVRSTTPPVAPAELALLSEMAGFELADDRQDVRDWPVRDAASEQVGVVADLVIDTRAGRVRYLLVSLGDVQKLVPVGYANLDEENDIVCTPELDVADLQSIPDYTVAELTRVKEEAIRASIEARLAGARRFRRPDYSTFSQP